MLAFLLTISLLGTPGLGPLGHRANGLPDGSNPANYNILCLGDSITRGTFVATAYPDVLHTTAATPNRTWNAGEGNDTTPGILNRWNIYYKTGTWNAVAVLGGVNDAILDLSAAAIFANLQAVYDDAHARGFKVVALTMTPWDTFVVSNSPRQAVTVAVNTSIRNYVTAHSSNTFLVDLYVSMADGVDPAKLNATFDSGDHLHPNQAGANLIASGVKTALGL